VLTSTAPRAGTSEDLGVDRPLVDVPLLDVVVPVYNEELKIESSIRRLRSFLDDEFPFPAIVTIVDNGSSDSTRAIATRLASEMGGVRTICLADKGRGRALRAAWSLTDAAIVAYTDVDLSTSLDALLPLVAPLLSGHSDLAIGNRLAPGARVLRGAKRELISRSYNLLLRAALGNGFTDAQCGFKAVRTDVARRLLPLIDDEAWFFDTELLVLAERSGLRIHEVPVDWVDDPDSRVNIVSTAFADLRGVARLLVSRRAAPSHPGKASGPVESTRLENVLRFARVGILSTVAYASLFLILRSVLGTYGANAIALVVCSVANLWIHHWLAARDDLEGRRRTGLILGGITGFLTSLLLTSAALLVADWIAGGAWLASAAALALATAFAGIIRFALLSSLAFRAHSHSGVHSHSGHSHSGHSHSGGTVNSDNEEMR
jgi:glycosyltransferase involved in cell wall biosynthesis